MKWIALAVWMPLAAQVTFEDIRKGPGENWLTYAGDYAGTRHSPLKQIDRGNVAQLTPKWVYHIDNARKLESVPIVYDGVMYVTNSNELHALDAKTGRRIWMFRDEQSPIQRVNRGAAILGDRVFFVSSDAHLIALHRKTGGLLWSRKYAEIEKGYFATLAPLVVKDKVIVGVGGGDSGMRGFISAHSASTGEELWRLYTVPARGEKGSESWSEKLIEYGGAATWLSGTYDPELNLIYWTTGNPWPDFYGGDRDGDNLYSCSLIAADADTGKMKWYFQFTPHDVHDWDGQGWPVLADVPVGGRTRKIVMHANRNGFYYILDRTTGEFLRATKYVDLLDWASGVDSKGRPVRIPGKLPTPDGNRVCPSVRGASNWMAPSLNPETGLFYVVTLEQCDKFYSSAKEPEPYKGFTGGAGELIPREPGKFFLRAIDPKTGERKWEYPMTGPGTMWAGTVSTAGGLVFFGDDDGQFVAVDARDGSHLWHFNMGQPLTASPVTYMTGGRQYVAIAAQTDVFVYGLHEPAKPVGVLPGLREKPSR